MPPAQLSVREISESEHLAFIESRRSASFLQTPAWGQVKSEWRRESLGWWVSTPGEAQDGQSSTNQERLVGAALVLYRQLPKLKRYLAYLPEGPVIDWDTDDLAAWLTPMAAYLKKQGAFGIRMGPPVVTCRWSAAQVKEGIADVSVRSLGDLAPTDRDPVGARVVTQLGELGWRKHGTDGGGFTAGQPQYVFQIPLVSNLRQAQDGSGPTDGRRSEDDVLAGMNQLWRRNIKKATKEGVEVTSSSSGEDLKAFHDLYVHTAERDHFTPRPLAYFRTMVEALGGEHPDRLKLWFARHEGDLVAATIATRVGAHAWYSYGASSTEKRDVRGSNAIQWAMIRDAISAGADVYDLRGITDTLDPDDSHVGLIQFKVGTGGEAVRYVGEWDLPLNRPLYKAFDLYMRRH
ncbi:MAG: peptidoglycan bridge formation glycyltransferase FemA/FemB family protein [Nocardioides sp.]